VAKEVMEVAEDIALHGSGWTTRLLRYAAFDSSKPAVSADRSVLLSP